MKRLELERFGRFRATQLEFGKTTILHGGNETGKSTLFAALRVALCRQPAPETYGAGADARARSDPIPLADYLHLHAVADGELRLDAEAYDKRLRAVATGAARAVAALERLASDDPSESHNRQRRELQERLVQLDHQEKEARQRLRLVYEAHDAVRRLTAMLPGYEEPVRGAEHTIRQIEAAIAGIEKAAALDQGRQAAQRRCRDAADRQRQATRRCQTLRGVICQRDELHARRALLQAQREDLAALEDLRDYDAETLAEFDRRDDTVRAHADKVSAIDRRRESCRARLQRVIDEIEVARASERASKRAATRALALRARLQRLLELPAFIERRQWRAGRVFGLLAALALLAAATWLGGFEPAVSLGLGVTLCSATFLFGRRTVREADREPTDRAVAKLVQEWNEDDSLPRLAGTTRGAVLSFCDEQIRAYELLRRQLDEHTSYKCRVEEELASILDTWHTELVAALGHREASRSAWAEQNGLNGGRDAYQAKVDAQRVRRERIANRPDLPGDQAGCDALEAELVNGIAQLYSDAGVAPEEHGAALAQEQDNVHLAFCEQLDAHREAVAAAVEYCEHLRSLATLEARLDAARAAHARSRLELEEVLAQRRQLVRQLGAANDPATALFAIGVERRRLEEEVAQHAADREAAALAAKALADLAADDTLRLRLLADRIGLLLELAGIGKRRVEVSSLREAGLLVSDASGELRPLARHCAGLRDLVILAARLALVEAVGTAKLLVLEEPFARLDTERALGGLRMVQAVQERGDWQVMIISRDAGLAAAARAVFREPHVIDLATLAA